MAQVGVVYKPQQIVSGKPLSLQDLQLADRGVKYVRIQWVDLINSVRFRIVPVSYFIRLCETARPGVCVAKATLGLVGIGMAEGFDGTGEYLYAIDLSSFRPCPYAPGHAVVMGWFQEKIPPLGGTLASPLCPRTLLQNIVHEAKAKAGLSFLAGFEHEFILLSATSPKLVTVNDAGYSCSAKSRTGTVEYVVMEEIADALQDVGIELQMVHAEAAPGQVCRSSSMQGAQNTCCTPSLRSSQAPFPLLRQPTLSCTRGRPSTTSPASMASAPHSLRGCTLIAVRLSSHIQELSFTSSRWQRGARTLLRALGQSVPSRHTTRREPRSDAQRYGALLSAGHLGAPPVPLRAHVAARRVLQADARRHLGGGHVLLLGHG